MLYLKHTLKYNLKFSVIYYVFIAMNLNKSFKLDAFCLCLNSGIRSVGFIYVNIYSVYLKYILKNCSIYEKNVCNNKS